MFNSRSILELCELGNRVLPSVSVMNVSGNVTYQVSGTATEADQKLIDLLDKVVAANKVIDKLNADILKITKQIGDLEKSRIDLEKSLKVQVTYLLALKKSGGDKTTIEEVQKGVDETRKTMDDLDKLVGELTATNAVHQKELADKIKERDGLLEEIRKKLEAQAVGIDSLTSANVPFPSAIAG